LVPLDVRPLVTGERVIRGSSYGSARTREDLPRLVELYRGGKLKIDELITRRYGLDEANEAFRALAAGELSRRLIVFCCRGSCARSSSAGTGAPTRTARGGRAQRHRAKRGARCWAPVPCMRSTRRSRASGLSSNRASSASTTGHSSRTARSRMAAPVA